MTSACFHVGGSAPTDKKEVSHDYAMFRCPVRWTLVRYFHLAPSVSNPAF